MPEFESYVDVDVEDFLSACSKKEIGYLIEYLVEDGYISHNAILNKGGKNLIEEEWESTVINLIEKRLMISNEDEEMIRSISKKY
jgi:hypothetical protein